MSEYAIREPCEERCGGTDLNIIPAGKAELFYASAFGRTGDLREYLYELSIVEALEVGQTQMDYDGVSKKIL